MIASLGSTVLACVVERESESENNLKWSPDSNNCLLSSLTLLMEREKVQDVPWSPNYLYKEGVGDRE